MWEQSFISFIGGSSISNIRLKPGLHLITRWSFCGHLGWLINVGGHSSVKPGLHLMTRWSFGVHLGVKGGHSSWSLTCKNINSSN